MSESRTRRQEISRQHAKREKQSRQFKALLAFLTVCALVFAGWFAYNKYQDSQNADGIPSSVRSYYSQAVEWKPCENGMQCATINAPVDWSGGSSDTVQLAVIKINATGTKQGTLFTNPGGPGASGYDWVKNSAMSTLSSKVTQAYDVIGFDPRGVNKSSGIKCLNDKDHDAYRSNTADPETDTGLQDLRNEYDKIAAQCKANSGPVLAHMDTASVAKDMDLLRSLSGDKTLNYLGFSYGTLLGSTYAGLFPKNVGHMVLDGAVDPALTYSEVTKGQAIGFEQSLKAFVDDCFTKSDCFFTANNVTSSDAAIAAIQKMLSDNDANPMKTKDGRTATSSLLASGIMVPLYNNLLWPTLQVSLGDALYSQSPDRLVQFADSSAGRNADGTYTGNSDFAFMAVNCLDYSIPSDTAAIRSDMDNLKQASPTFGRFMAGAGAICEKWPYKTIRNLGPISTSSTNPLLVIGTTGDPATPFASAENLTKELGSAKLLKWNGQGHTAYGRSNDCVRSTVDNFLLTGALPEDGKTC